MAEAMALGKPVVATGYSGNLHFMTPENSYLVDYAQNARARRLRSVPDDARPGPIRISIRRPRICEQVVRAARPGGAARARKGQQDVLERHNRQTSARAIAARVEAIRRERRSRVVGLPGASETATTGAPVGPPAPVGVDAARVNAGVRSPRRRRCGSARRALACRAFGSLAQRALFRVLRPLWFQQHQFHAQRRRGAAADGRRDAHRAAGARDRRSQGARADAEAPVGAAGNASTPAIGGSDAARRPRRN